MTTIINFFGAAGCAKSTLAASLYAYMKKKQYNVELIQEYIKFEWIYENKTIQPFDELRILGTQSYMETRLFDKVDFIITDSPVFLVSLYAPFIASPKVTEALQHLVEVYYEDCAHRGIKYKNFFINRNSSLDPLHRFQKDQDEVVRLDKLLQTLLDDFNYFYGGLLHYNEISFDFNDWQQFF